MIRIQSDFPLLQYNTFGINASTAFFTEINSVNQIHELVDTETFIRNPHFILGGGSNILLTKNYPGLLFIQELPVQNCLKKMTLTYIPGLEAVWYGMNSSAFQWITIGEVLKIFSGIPGTVGASPIQNIGAYGAEVKDVVVKVEGFDFEHNDFITFDNASCKFGYRTSIFKEKLKNRFLVCYVTFRLKKAPHMLITNYGSIEKELEKYPQRRHSNYPEDSMCNPKCETT